MLHGTGNIAKNAATLGLSSMGHILGVRAGDELLASVESNDQIDILIS